MEHKRKEGHLAASSKVSWETVFLHLRFLDLLKPSCLEFFFLNAHFQALPFNNLSAVGLTAIFVFTIQVY